MEQQKKVVYMSTNDQAFYVTRICVYMSKFKQGVTISFMKSKNCNFFK